MNSEKEFKKRVTRRSFQSAENMANDNDKVTKSNADFQQSSASMRTFVKGRQTAYELLENFELPNLDDILSPSSLDSSDSDGDDVDVRPNTFIPKHLKKPSNTDNTDDGGRRMKAKENLVEMEVERTKEVRGRKIGSKASSEESSKGMEESSKLREKNAVLQHQVGPIEGNKEFLGRRSRNKRTLMESLSSSPSDDNSREIEEISHPITNKKRYECKLCGKDFIDKDAFIEHAETHTGEKPFECEFCGRKYELEIGLKNHLKTHVDRSGKGITGGDSSSQEPDTHEIPKIKCDLCGKVFITKANLIRHIQSHRGDKPFECEFCGRKYWHEGSLKTHLKKHTSRTCLQKTRGKRKLTKSQV